MTLVIRMTEDGSPHVWARGDEGDYLVEHGRKEPLAVLAILQSLGFGGEFRPGGTVVLEGWPKRFL